MKCYMNKALQRRVIRVSETFEESRSSGDARSDRRECPVCPWQGLSAPADWGWDSCKEKAQRSAELISLLATSETNLFVERSSNVNRTSNSTTYHRVVTDSEESHHLNVCWNWWRTCELCVRVHTTHSVGHSLRSECQHLLYASLKPCKPLICIRIITPIQ